MKSEMVS